MSRLHLLRFIKFHFWKLKMTSVIIFHCWNQESSPELINSNVISTITTYLQFIDENTLLYDDSLFYRNLKSNTGKIGIFIDLQCNQSQLLLQKINNLDLFNGNYYHWLIFNNNDNDLNILQSIFSNIDLSVNTDLSYAITKQQKQQQGEKKNSNKMATIEFSIYDVYNNGYKNGGKLNITGDYTIECDGLICNQLNYLTDLYKRSKYGNRNRLSDITFKVAILSTVFNIHTHTAAEIDYYLFVQSDYHIDPISRMGYQIMTLIIESLYVNITRSYYDIWSSTEIDEGVVGALINHNADMISSPLAASLSRSIYLTPIAVTGEVKTICMFRTPRNSGIQGLVFLEPFSTHVWVFFLVTLLCISLFLWLSFYIEYRRLKSYISRNFLPSLLTTCLISFGTACSQGSYLIPYSIGGRIAFISLSLICFIMYNYYTSVVVALLLGSPIKSNIKTLSDLADSRLSISFQIAPHLASYLNFSTYPEIRRIAKRTIYKKSYDENWLQLNDGILKMRDKPGFVFIFEALSGYYFIENNFNALEICDLNEILFRPDRNLHTHLNRNSTYKEIIRQKIIRILETGVYAKHRNERIKDRLYCLTNNLMITVSIESIATYFFLLIVGYLISVIIFIIEHLWKRSNTDRIRYDKSINMIMMND